MRDALELRKTEEITEFRFSYHAHAVTYCMEEWTELMSLGFDCVYFSCCYVL